MKWDKNLIIFNKKLCRYHVYKIRPVIARNFECEWVNGGFQCTKVCWQTASPFR